MNKLVKQVNQPVNYLVNGAVYFGSKGLTALKSDWDKSFGVNVIGYSNMVQACHSHMRSIEGIYSKSIVNIASISAHRVCAMCVCISTKLDHLSQTIVILVNYLCNYFQNLHVVLIISYF